MKNNHYGGFFRRLIAFVIDCLILGAITQIVSYVSTAALGLFLSEEALENAHRANRALSYALPLFYFIYFHGSTGRTPGKSLLGIKVVQESGDPIGYGTAFLRWVGYLVSALFALGGFIWIIFDGRKQGWHDKIAKTYVVNARQHHQVRSDFSYRSGYPF